jgi:hypothetical protein
MVNPSRVKISGHIGYNTYVLDLKPHGVFNTYVLDLKPRGVFKHEMCPQKNCLLNPFWIQNEPLDFQKNRNLVCAKFKSKSKYTMC